MILTLSDFTFVSDEWIFEHNTFSAKIYKNLSGKHQKKVSIEYKSKIDNWPIHDEILFLHNDMDHILDTINDYYKRWRKMNDNIL